MPTPNRRLRQARELRGWSQAKVAEQIGTDATTVSRWERGLFSPTPYFRERLCELFGKNAEELGLLDNGRQQPEQSGNGTFAPASAMPPAFSEAQIDYPGSGETCYPWGTIPLQAPSWQERTDTFAYILQSAAHDVQAHLLWEDAYVRVLQGQRAQARQFGEASLNAFEQVGHMNAAALREWLNQHGLATPPPAASTSVANPPSSPAPPLAERPVGAIRRFGYGRSLGFLLVLLMVATVVLCGLSFSQFQPMVLSSPRVSPVRQDASSASTSFVSPTAAAGRTEAPLPTASALPQPVATATAVSVVPSLSITLRPQKLTPRDCPSEPLGYRCTVSFWLLFDGGVKVSWRAKSSGLGAFFNPQQGTCASGQWVQVIIYIPSEPGQRGQLLFLFTLPASGKTYISTVDWES